MPKPVMRDATDAVMRVTGTTICGTDMHILKGDLPTVAEGRILGHEGIGVIEEIGSGVSRVCSYQFIFLFLLSAAMTGMFIVCEPGLSIGSDPPIN